MSKEEIRETLEKQLQLLSERSEQCAFPNELAELTEKMIHLSRLLLNLQKGIQPDKFIPSDSCSECPEPNQKCSC